MRILRGVEIPIAICISYTILSMINVIIDLLRGRASGSHYNSIAMLLLCTIAVLVLSIHHLFDEWSPVLMIIIQYVIAMGLVLLLVFISSFFTEVSEGGYKDIIISFTVPYMIGAFIYYSSVFRSAKRQDRLIQEINSGREK